MRTPVGSDLKRWLHMVAATVHGKVKRLLTWFGFGLLVGLVFLLRPLANVRLAVFRAEKLGHFVSESDLMLIGLMEKWRVKERLSRQKNILVMPAVPSNSQIRDMYLRAVGNIEDVTALNCESSRLGRLLQAPTRLLTTKAQREGRFTNFFAGSMHSGGLHHTGLFSPEMPILSFTPAEIERGWMELEHWGLRRDAAYVCVHIRDSAYLASSEPWRDWSYHDYRNPDLWRYIPTIQFLLSRGYFVFRMGRIAETPLPLSHPNLIDYAFSTNQSDFLDVFIYAHATMQISGSASGIDNLGYAFLRPAVLLDLIPFQPQIAIPNLVVAPALLQDESSGSLLPLSEMARHQYFRTDQYQDAGLRILRTTENEILDAVREGLARSSGNWTTDTSDTTDQVRFWEWFQVCGLNDGTRVGPERSRYYQHHLAQTFFRNHRAALLS